MRAPVPYPTMQPVHRGARGRFLSRTGGPAEQRLHLGELLPQRLVIHHRKPSKCIGGLDRVIDLPPLRLRQDRSEAREHLVHDRLRDGLQPSPVPGGKIENARLVATDHPSRPGAGIVQRYREPAPPRETPAGGDGQHHRRPGQRVEWRGGDDYDRPRPSLFMAGHGIEADKPDITTLH